MTVLAVVVVVVGMILGEVEGVDGAEGKEAEENLRAEVNMDVELSNAPAGTEVMNAPRSLEVHRPDRTAVLNQRTPPEAWPVYRYGKATVQGSSPAEVVQIYVFYSPSSIISIPGVPPEHTHRPKCATHRVVRCIHSELGDVVPFVYDECDLTGRCGVEGDCAESLSVGSESTEGRDMLTLYVRFFPTPHTRTHLSQ